MIFWVAECLPAQENTALTISNDPSDSAISDPISDGSVSPPAAKPTLPDFKVKHTLTTTMNVKEAPEMPGLPPVEGPIKVTVQLVEDPHFPDPPPPLPPLPVDDPAVKARMDELGKTYRDTELVFLSATVYDHSRTLIRWYPGGGKTKEMAAWSNLDFNHFSGFATYQVKQTDGTVRQYGLMMGIGNQETGSNRQRLDTGVFPEIPALPNKETAGPAYIVTEGDTSNLGAMEIIQGLHDLYRVEGARMAAAYESRTKAEAARRAYLLVHPSMPEDVTIQFWRPDKSSKQKSATNSGEGAR